MVNNKMPALKIVRSYPGPGTAETVYVTEDGATWQKDESNHSNETGSPRLGWVSGDMMLPR